MISKKRILGSNVFWLFCVIACFAMSLAAGCRSRTAGPVDDEPNENATLSSQDASLCDLDSGVPWATAPATVPSGDTESVVLSPADSCNNAPTTESRLLHDVWKRALDHLGPQDPTKPPSMDACRTAEVMERIGIKEAETILRRCPHPEPQNLSGQKVKTAPPKVSLRVHRHGLRIEVDGARPRVLGRVA